MDKPKKLILSRSNGDDELDVFYGKKHLLSANHVDDGWHGISQIESLVRAIGIALDIPVEEEY